LLADDGVIAQQKLDGIRVLTHVGETLRVTNRAGQLTTVHASILAALDSVPAGTILDGELVPGDDGPTYWLFDVLEIAGQDLRGLGYLERWERLDAEIEPAVDHPIRILAYASGTAAKQALYERLHQASAEGMVFKRADAA
jgi:ATP-dependent DNA ligase